MNAGHDRTEGLLAKDRLLRQLELDREREDAWLEVIRKMDEVYSDLLRYEADLESKNAELEEAQTFISSVIDLGLRHSDRVRLHGLIQQVNPALVRIIGRPDADIVGRELSYFVDPRDASGSSTC